MMKSSCRAGLHRELLNSAASAFHQGKRASGMHLKPYLKLQKKERGLEISQNPLSAPCTNLQRSAKEEKHIANCTKPSLSPISSPTVSPSSRKPLGILSPNTMCDRSGKAPAEGLCVKEKRSSPSATIHQGEEGEGPLDIWAVVKPGNTKEKIAFFAAQQCSESRVPSMKIKSSWDIDGRAAKRRKKSLDLTKAKIQLERMREASGRCYQSEPFACGIEHCSVHYVNDNMDGGFPNQSLSVIEMVAFLEQRASTLLSDCTKNCASVSAAPTKFPGQSKGTLPVPDPFPAVGACEVHAKKGTCGSVEQPSEPVRVLDMVAKLESECLRHQSEREAGSLSRNNSFRRNVGRVLLANSTQSENEAGKESNEGLNQEGCLEDAATADEDRQTAKRGPSIEDNAWEGAATGQPSLLAAGDVCIVNSGLKLSQETPAMPGTRSETQVLAEPLPSAFPKAVGQAMDSSHSESMTIDCTSREPLVLSNLNSDLAVKEALCISILVTKAENGCRKEQLSTFSFREDFLPGRLFFQPPERQTHVEHIWLGESLVGKLRDVVQIEDSSESDPVGVLKRVSAELTALPDSPTESALQVLDASWLKRQVSHDFLETRFKIQQLLEPQQYMAFLPHHIMVKIFGLLPTRSLVALKCTCCYFKFIIEYYNIRPADSRWVRDPRYREDPCKQCKKKYVKGDVSLCRWHPKPYCQALPYGPGYWMCCHRSQKGVPGCKLGLHDNQWVPACHSFNRAIHKKSREVEEEF
uniref:F-box protein 34 n=1 Tax=Sphenodon punctatus TaxID=8508 RepID=A0A8D0GCW0_SPHPU